MSFLSSASVNTLYIVLLILGLIYALFLLFTGHLGMDMDAGGDVDVGGHFDLGGHDGSTEHALSPISPLTIATFVTAFGAVGLISKTMFDVSDRGSLVWASLGGIAFSAITYIGFLYLFIKPQGSSEVRIADLAGQIGEIITPIPKGGLGEIALVAQGGRVTFSARSRTGEGIGRGTPVKVVRILGGVAFVEPAEES